MGSAYRICACLMRSFRITEAEPPADVEEAFRRCSQDGAQMTAEQLRRFLVEVQGETGAMVDDAERILDQILQKQRRVAKFTGPTLTLGDFLRFLCSPDLNPPINSQVHHDMGAPLSHYFMYTGHNSYLTGNQLTSPSSGVPIINALKRGVRVIELDLWPNFKKDDVHVLHGRTWTRPVKLMTCLKSIKNHAFAASPYPVIITLEDHLTPDLQAKVAEMLIKTFGEMLFQPQSEFTEFPSPEGLKNRILVSTRPPKEDLEAQSSKSNNDKSDHTLDDEDNDNCDQNLCPSEPPAYKQLIAIPAGKTKGSLKEALKFEIGKPRRLSLCEQKLEKAAKAHEVDIVSFTQKNILRVYPRGTRVKSSNYNPQVGWMHGAQMVAFNMQGYDEALWLMQGMFRSNGACGFVKKPDLLMKRGPNNDVFNPKVKLPVKTTLKVKVYMGDGWRLDFKQTHFDWCSPPDFYTRVGIAGVPADEVKVMMKTKKQENTWTPVWNEEFTFALTVPELALLRIEVNEYDVVKDDFGGQTCLPVSELRKGIRAVPLFDRKGKKYKHVMLLMRFEFV